MLTAQPAMDRPNRLQVAGWVLVMLVGLALCLRNYNSFQLGTWRDDAHYIILARSLVESDRFGLINAPGLPDSTQYPFGYPLLLVPLLLLFPDQPDRLKILSLIATLLNISLIFWGWRRLSHSTSNWWGLAVAGLYVLLPSTVSFSRMVMSEPIFISFCLAALLVTEQMIADQQFRWRWIGLLSLLLTFGMFIRTIGATLVATSFVYVALARGFRAWRELISVSVGMGLLLVLIVAATPLRVENLLPFRYGGAISNSSVEAAAFAAGSTTTESPRASSVLDTLTGYLQFDIRQAVLPFQIGDKERTVADRLGLPSLPLYLGLLVSIIIVLGYLRWYQQDGLSVFLLFSIVYFGALLMWPWRQPRFLYPIQPQLLFGFLLGLEGILFGVSHLRRRPGATRAWATRLLAVLVVALMAFSAVESFRIEDSRLYVGDLQARSDWLRANSDPSAIVMTEEPQVDFIYSGRKTVPYLDPWPSANDLEGYLLKGQVGYVLVAPLIDWQPTSTPTYSRRTERLRPLLSDLVARARLKPVYTLDVDGVEVYQVQP